MAGKLSEQTNMNGAASIDRTADFIEVTDSSGPTTYKATPNFILGITGAPVGTTDTQTLTGKTLTAPTISGPTLSGTILGTYTLGGSPTFPSSVTTLTGVQILTNKTLTSPTINTPTIVNPTITTDAISEFTAANGVSVDGLNIKDSKLNTNNSVVTANVTDGAVTPAKLQTGTGSTWGLQSHTSVLTNITIGTGGSSGTVFKYVQTGKWVTCWVTMTFGASPSVASDPYFTLPVTASSSYTAVNKDKGNLIGIADYLDNGTGSYFGYCRLRSTTTCTPVVVGTGGSYASLTALAAGVPFTVAADDQWYFIIQYEAA